MFAGGHALLCESFWGEDEASCAEAPTLVKTLWSNIWHSGRATRCGPNRLCHLLARRSAHQVIAFASGAAHNARKLQRRVDFPQLRPVVTEVCLLPIEFGEKKGKETCNQIPFSS